VSLGRRRLSTGDADEGSTAGEHVADATSPPFRSSAAPHDGVDGLPDAPEPLSSWMPAPPPEPSWVMTDSEARSAAPTTPGSTPDDSGGGPSEPEVSSAAIPTAPMSGPKRTNASTSPATVPSHPEPVEAPGEPSREDLLPVLLENPQLPPQLLELKIAARDALIERMGTRLYDRSLTEEQIESYVITELGGWLFEQSTRLSPAEHELLSRDLINDVLRHGPIEPFLEDDTVTEIMVNGLSSIYIERNGKLRRTNSKFATEAHLRQVIERIVSKVGRRIDESSPMVDARLPDGSRVNAVVPPLAVDGPSLTIRKFAKEALTVDDLVSFRTLTPTSVSFLHACVRGRTNILVSGGTGTGKTTLLNVLSSFIPSDERIVTIEDAVELQLKQDHVVRLESRPPNVEGRGQITIRDLVRNSLRMRPDRVIIGECRSGEALDMLQAMNTGHDGSLSTLHANGPRDAIARLETLCLMSGMELPMMAIREQIASAVDVIVHVARLRDGTRRVTHISEVVGMDANAVGLSDIFVFDYDAGLDIEGKYAGGLVPTGLTPVLLTKLGEHGETVDPALFEVDDLVGAPK
jgi:pilus assembly protein CpaF